MGGKRKKGGRAGKSAEKEGVKAMEKDEKDEDGGKERRSSDVDLKADDKDEERSKG